MARHAGDRTFHWGTRVVALLLVAAFLYLVWVLAEKSYPTFAALGPRFVWASKWDPSNNVFGALPFIFGTFVSSAIALVLAVPVAIGTAIALATLLPRWLSGPLGILIELTAAVPSIVFGVWGLYTIVPWVKDISGGRSAGPSLLAAGFVLAAMILPIITAVSRDMLSAVPKTQRDAALALGATPWEVTWKVVLPHARSGLVAAILLGFGRAVGETMAVILLIGNQPILHLDIFQPAATMASVIANEFGEASGSLQGSSLVALGLLLLLFSLALNLAARWIVRRFGVKS